MTCSFTVSLTQSVLQDSMEKTTTCIVFFIEKEKVPSLSILIIDHTIGTLQNYIINAFYAFNIQITGTHY